MSGASASAAAPSARERGNAAFQAGRKSEAEALYTESIASLSEDDPERVLSLANRALTRLQLGNAAGALEDADESLRHRPLWGKGLHRRARALIALERDLDAFRFLVEALDVPAEQARDITPEQRRSLAKELSAIRTGLAKVYSIDAEPADAAGWVTALEVQGNFRVRLATLAHCWNAAEPDERVMVLDTALELLAAAPDPARSPIQSFAAMSASEDVRAAGAGAELSPDAVATRAVELSKPHPEGPLRAADAGVAASDLKAFPMANYADIAAPAPLLRFFVGLAPEGKVALWRAMWDRLPFYERMLVANDFSLFFERLARLCPLLEAAVGRLRETVAAHGGSPGSAPSE